MPTGLLCQCVLYFLWCVREFDFFSVPHDQLFLACKVHTCKLHAAAAMLAQRSLFAYAPGAGTLLQCSNTVLEEFDWDFGPDDEKKELTNQQPVCKDVTNGSKFCRHG
jgi:hypothetical protein